MADEVILKVGPITSTEFVNFFAKSQLLVPACLRRAIRTTGKRIPIHPFFA
jgi:hypothetical protein